jgi:hypothetical protein
VTAIGNAALLAEGSNLDLAGGTAIAIITVNAVILAEVLADAEQYRRDRAAEPCADCEIAPAGACEKHLDDLDRADAYRDLAASFPGTVPQAG